MKKDVFKNSLLDGENREKILPYFDS